MDDLIAFFEASKEEVFTNKKTGKPLAKSTQGKIQAKLDLACTIVRKASQLQVTADLVDAIYISESNEPIIEFGNLARKVRVACLSGITCVALYTDDEYRNAFTMRYTQTDKDITALLRLVVKFIQTQKITAETIIAFRLAPQPKRRKVRLT